MNVTLQDLKNGDILLSDAGNFYIVTTSGAAMYLEGAVDVEATRVSDGHLTFWYNNPPDKRLECVWIWHSRYGCLLT